MLEEDEKEGGGERTRDDDEDEGSSQHQRRHRRRRRSRWRSTLRLVLVAGLLAPLLPSLCSANEPEERLMIDLFRGYNALVQPVRNKSDIPQIVKIAMQLVLLINVDEKDQIMHTNVWLTLKWHDFQLVWEPKDYEGMHQVRVSPDKIWLPDIVLFNNADGNYEVSFMCNVLINHNGDVLWVPPAIYKSSCIIDVEYFPFDQQTCHLIFGSWTYNRYEIKLDFAHADRVDVSEYAPSSIWDLIDAPAVLVEDRSRIEFQVTIRRKTLFFTIVLIVPTVLMAFLNVTVFFLPTASGEKMGLTMNVLLSIVVFLLLVSKILPPTSSSIPLVAKYLLLTFVLNIITILITVVIINIYFRSPLTHKLPNWVRTVFLEWLPVLLCMPRPRRFSRLITQRKVQMRQLLSPPPAANHHPLCEGGPDDKAGGPKSAPSIRVVSTCGGGEHGDELTPEAQRAIDAIEFITETVKDEEIVRQYKDDWRYVAMVAAFVVIVVMALTKEKSKVVDRVLLYAFSGITLGGTCGILFSAPTVFEPIDQTARLQELIHLYKQGLGSD